MVFPEGTELQMALHYLKVLQKNYGVMQPEIRDAIDVAVSVVDEKITSQFIEERT